MNQYQQIEELLNPHNMFLEEDRNIGRWYILTPYKQTKDETLNIYYGHFYVNRVNQEISRLILSINSDSKEAKIIQTIAVLLDVEIRHVSTPQYYG